MPLFLFLGGDHFLRCGFDCGGFLCGGLLGFSFGGHVFWGVFGFGFVGEMDVSPPSEPSCVGISRL